jgi:hypothetical protein
MGKEFALVKVTCDENSCRISLLERDSEEFTLAEMEKEINAKICALVTLQDPLHKLNSIHHAHLMAVIDDNGILKDRAFNPVASLFYAPWQAYIAGDCVLCWDFPSCLDEEPDAFAFPREFADLLIEELRPLFTEKVIFDIQQAS